MSVLEHQYVHTAHACWVMVVSISVKSSSAGENAQLSCGRYVTMTDVLQVDLDLSYGTVSMMGLMSLACTFLVPSLPPPPPHTHPAPHSPNSTCKLGNCKRVVCRHGQWYPPDVNKAGLFVRATRTYRYHGAQQHGSMHSLYVPRAARVGRQYSCHHCT